MKKWYTIRAIIHDGGFFMKRELIDDILDPNFNFDEDYYEDTNTDVETTCLNCGYTEHVPDFIYGECSRKKYHLKLKKRVPTLYCSKCDKETAVPSNFLKN